MSVDLREWLPDLFQYKLTVVCIIGQLLVAHRRGIGRALARPAADLTWFVPVFIWGLESLHHLAWWLFESHGFCFGPPISETLLRAELTCLLMVGIVSACFLSEHKARGSGRPVRASQATIPLPVVAALIGVQWTWALCLSVLYAPLR